MDIESDGAGGFSLRTGVPRGGKGGQTKKTTAAIESKQLAYRETVSRLEGIKAKFKPEYQEIGSRLGAAWTSTKAFLGMKDRISKKDKTFLTKYAAYKRRSISNINLYIKEITGAQMSEKEADRLRLAQPDPGEKWYQGDDPITFMGKLEDAVDYSRAAISRYDWYRAKGTLTDKQIEDLVNADQAISLDDLVERMREGREGG
jgi:hypothetical protein